MKIELYFELPDHAVQIRKQVFVEEQGFQEEFDELDAQAAHLVLYKWRKPVGICRVFENRDKGCWVLGRLAVLPKYRNRNLGGRLIEAAQEYIRGVGGKQLHVHAQCRVTGFYEKQGFTAYGEIEPEEGCPHIWMQKTI